jgi:L-ascorbate peroxidase
MAAPLVDAEYLRQIDRARRALRALIASKGCAPIMLRLAYVPFPVSVSPL